MSTLPKLVVHRSRFVKHLPFGQYEAHYEISPQRVLFYIGIWQASYSIKELSNVVSFMKHAGSGRSSSSYCVLSNHEDYRAAKSRFARDISSYKRLASILWTVDGLGLEYSICWTPDYVTLENMQTRRTPYGEHSHSCNKRGLISLAE